MIDEETTKFKHESKIAKALAFSVANKKNPIVNGCVQVDGVLVLKAESIIELYQSLIINITKEDLDGDCCVKLEYWISEAREALRIHESFAKQMSAKDKASNPKASKKGKADG